MTIALQPTDAQPPHGSVVVTQGLTGTAHQRFYSDGLYHAAGRVGGVSYADLFLRSNGQPCSVFLLYTPVEEYR